ncbi:CBS domain-containing protein [Arachis hypogaea]|nr:CBS domain-containing protein [Arachis hypogaea]
MESVNPSAVTPSKNLARNFAKVLHLRALIGITPVDGLKDVISDANLKDDGNIGKGTINRSQTFNKDGVICMLAKKLHPDTNKDDPEAEKKFQWHMSISITKKYWGVLWCTRSSCIDVGHDAYVNQQSTGFGDSSGFNPFEQIFRDHDFVKNFFHQNIGGEDVKPSWDVPKLLHMKQMCVAKLVILSTFAGGSGIPPGTKPETCKRCKGIGMTYVQAGIFRMENTCGTCKGMGKIVKNFCKSCKGAKVIKGTKSVKLDIAPGMDNNETLKICRSGGVDPDGDHPGDLYVTLKVREDPVFRREGSDIHVKCCFKYYSGFRDKGIETKGWEKIGLQGEDLVWNPQSNLPSESGSSAGCFVTSQESWSFNLGNLVSLTDLDLSRNNFVKVPININELPGLRRLNLDYCPNLKDVASRVIAEGLLPEQTPVSNVMTCTPIFVTSDTLAIEALQKMVQGKFRHLPIVENGEVIAMLDITKCLYDAISRMEKAAQQGSAIAAAVEGVELQRGSNGSGWVAIVSSSDPVQVAAKKMRELRVNSAVIANETKLQGILTSKDILMRVVAQNLAPETTPAEKVMTSNPEHASLETTILDALHMMHDGKFLHLPVVDKDGNIAACLDVLQITTAAISLVESSSGTVNDVANSIMQKFWDSALALEPPDDYDTQSEASGIMNSDGADTAKSTYQSVGHGNSFIFKFEDPNGRVHRVTCGAENLDELVSAIMERVSNNDRSRPVILYDDDEGDKIVIANDSDLVSAVSYARSAGLKALKLDLEFTDSAKPVTPESAIAMTTTTATRRKTGGGMLSIRSSIFAGAVVLTSIGVVAYLKRSNQ